MSSRRVFLCSTCMAVLSAVSLALNAQTDNSRPTTLAQTVSIGDVVKAEDQMATRTELQQVLASTAGATTRTILTNAPPIHLIYVHGINQIGPNDSKLLRDGICKFLKECIAVADTKRIYATGAFGVKSAVPDLTYLQEPVWSSPEEWTAATPYIQRYRISGNGHAPIVLDELNWYPLAYALKCKFLLPPDEQLSGFAKTQEAACRPPKNIPDPESKDYFREYRWPVDKAVMDLDLRKQHATVLNHSLKVNLMDWGFGDAVMALGPMQEILCSAIRQLLAQSLNDMAVDPSGSPMNVDAEKLPVFFVTHSLGSFLSLAAMDSDWLGSTKPELTQFQMTEEQKQAADYFAAHTTGFYFLANQIALLELARLTPSASAPGNTCAEVANASKNVVLTASTAVASYGCKRQAYLNTHAASGMPVNAPQIIAWSAADDLLSWYVPRMPSVSPVNLPAKNSSFRIPRLIAGPSGVHDNYAKNKSVVRTIFAPK